MKDKLFDSYMESVKESLMGKCSYLSEEEADKYIALCMNFIRKRYEADLKKYKQGKITERVLIEGGGNSCGYCLGLCYDMPMD